jgi:hypothetical protein
VLFKHHPTPPMNLFDSDKQATVAYGKFLTEQRAAFLENYRKEFSRLLKYGETLMATLAIIAGFGFTAFEFIKDLVLFFGGETFVVFAILYLIYKTKSYLEGQILSTEQWINTNFSKTPAIKKALLENDQTNIEKFSKEFNDSLIDTSEAYPLQTSKDASKALNTAFICGIIGIGIIFISFFC